MSPPRQQLDLFEADGPTAPAGVGPVAPTPGLAELAGRLPLQVRLGTSSWSFPGWRDIVYDRTVSERVLAREGLAAYARHPLLRAVGIDRTYYAPVEEDVYARYAAMVPEGFRFLVKAPELLTVSRFPRHPRYGGHRGLGNPRYLDPAFAEAEFVGPAAQGLGGRLGALLFQFPPQDVRAAGEGEVFAERLHRFLEKLPRGPLYAVEIRNVDWLTPAYRQALHAVGAVHCVTLHPRMPSAEAQVRLATSPDDPALVLRWMLRDPQSYEAARSRYAPFDRLVDPDPQRRADVAALCLQAAAAGRPALVTINNKAEGSAPLSAFALAEAIASSRGA